MTKIDITGITNVIKICKMQTESNSKSLTL